MNYIIKIFLITIVLHISLSARDINLNNLVKTASDSNKHLFVWLHKTECGYCDRMSEISLDNDINRALIKKKFLFVHINIDDKDKVTYKEFVGSGRNFAKDIGFDFYPTSLFFDNVGRVVHEAVGYHDEKVFYKVLKFIYTKSYEKVNYDTFEYEEEF